jgi:hypothetical protein
MRKLAVGAVSSVITIVLLQAGCATPTSQKAPGSSAGPGSPAIAPPAVAATSAADNRSPLRQPPRSRHAHHHHRHATAKPTHTMLAPPWCTAIASYNEQYDAYSVSVSSNQFNQIGTATSNGQTQSYSTDASGHAYINIDGSANIGQIAIILRVGAATCFATV